DSVLSSRQERVAIEFSSLAGSRSSTGWPFMDLRRNLSTRLHSHAWRPTAPPASFGEGSSTRAEPNPSTGPGPCLFSADFSAGLWRRRSTMAPLDSQLAATILQTE